MRTSYDAVVVGSGPNGLAAAITIARAGRSVLVLEADTKAGGGTRSAELTLPGFVHDVCSAIHPLLVASPLLSKLPLSKYGLDLVYPPAAVAHPFDDGTAAVLERSVLATGETLGRDAEAYRRLMQPLVDDAGKIFADLLGPLPLPPHHPLAFGRFGLYAVQPAMTFATTRFREARARALFGGLAAHSMLPLDKLVTAGFGLGLGIAGHAIGWPLARCGSDKIANAMVAYLQALGGEITTGWRVESMDELPAARAYLFDVTPRQLVRIAGKRLPDGYRRQLDRYRYGAGVFKMDWALDGPIPWRSAQCARAATVHIGGTLDEIAVSEAEVARGIHPDAPFVLLAQQSLFDPTRAPEGKQTAWAYCHVPNGSVVDMTSRIEKQIERFAPGFRDRILARSAMSPSAMERHDANYIGGDINGGVQDLWQLYSRPAWRLNPYSTPARGIYICSSSTPPGGGVHGMCGYHAAQTALRQVL